MAHLAHSTVAIVRGHFDDESDTPGTVALKGDLLIDRSGQFTGAALNGALDVVLRHVLRLGSGDGPAQPGIGVHISPALASSHGDFPDQAGEDLAALGIKCALFVLDCGPFGMAGHSNLYWLNLTAKRTGASRRKASIARSPGPCSAWLRQGA